MNDLFTILFTGHMIDKNDRPIPRFPANKADAVGEHILDEIKEIQQRHESLRGISQAACGGDILFLEACRSLNIDCEILLPQSINEFKKKSVAFAGEEWEYRFDDLIRFFPVEEMDVDESLGENKYDAINKRMLLEAKERSGKNVLMLALWDGNKGDGPGGTDSFIKDALQAGFEVKVISPV